MWLPICLFWHIFLSPVPIVNFIMFLKAKQLMNMSLFFQLLPPLYSNVLVTCYVTESATLRGKSLIDIIGATLFLRNS